MTAATAQLPWTLRRHAWLPGIAWAILLSIGAALAACGSDERDVVRMADNARGAVDIKRAQIALNQLTAVEPANYRARIVAGRIALRLGDPRRAIAQYRQVPDRSKLYVEAQTGLAEALLAAGEIAAARRISDNLPLDTSEQARIAIEIALAENRSEDARRLLHDARSTYPNAPALAALAAQLALQDGRSKQAAELVADAWRKSPEDVALNLMAGRIALRERRLSDARDRFSAVLRKRPNDRSALLALAAIARDMGDMTTADEWLMRLRKTGSYAPAAAYFAAQLAYDRGDIARGELLLRRASYSDAEFSQMTRLDALVQARRQISAEAIETLRQQLAKDRDDPVVRLALARHLNGVGQHREAWAILSPNLERINGDRGSLALAAELARILRSPEVAETVQRAEATVRKGPLLDGMRAAGLAIRAGDWAKADSIFAPLIDGAGARDAALLNNAANVKLQLGESDKAIDLARRAAELAPKESAIRDTLGWALFQGGDTPAEARRHVSAALEMDPDNREIAAHLAAIDRGLP